VNLFDHIPTHAKVIGNPTDCSELKEIQNGKGKGSNKSMLPQHKGKAGPPKGVAGLALRSVEGKSKDAPFTANGTHMQLKRFLPPESNMPAPALRTADEIPFYIRKKYHGITLVTCCFISDTLQIESMIKN